MGSGAEPHYQSVGDTSLHSGLGSGVEFFAVDPAELPGMGAAGAGCGAADGQIADEMQRGVQIAELADAQDDRILLGMRAAAGEFPGVVIEMMTDDGDIAAFENMRAGQDEQLRALTERIMSHKNTSSRVSYTLIIQEIGRKCKPECDNQVKVSKIDRKLRSDFCSGHGKPPETVNFAMPICKN